MTGIVRHTTEADVAAAVAIQSTAFGGNADGCAIRRSNAALIQL